MVWHSATVTGSLEHQPKLIAHPLLTLEIGEARRPKHGFGSPLAGISMRTYECREILIADVTHDR
jgi:hypothetical protein